MCTHQEILLVQVQEEDDKRFDYSTHYLAAYCYVCNSYINGVVAEGDDSISWQDLPLDKWKLNIQDETNTRWRPISPLKSRKLRKLILRYHKCINFTLDSKSKI